MTIGKKIKKQRQSIGMTQADLATKIGVTQSAIAHYEADKRATSLDVIVKIAKALRVDVAELIGKSGKARAR